MSDRIQGGDAYENAILRPERGREVAPRLTVGFAELLALLSDGEEHPRADCYMVMEESGERGLATATAAMLLERAIFYGQLVGRFGYEQRIGPSGVPRNIRLYVGYRLTPEGLARARSAAAELSSSAVTRDPREGVGDVGSAERSASKRPRSSSRRSGPKSQVTRDP